MDDDLEDQICEGYEFEEFIENDDDSGDSDEGVGCCVLLVTFLGGASALIWA
jgi:hypothetical protein